MKGKVISVLEAARSKIKVVGDLVSAEGLLPGSGKAVISLSSHRGRGEPFSGMSYQGTNPICVCSTIMT